MFERKWVAVIEEVPTKSAHLLKELRHLCFVIVDAHQLAAAVAKLEQVEVASALHHTAHPKKAFQSIIRHEKQEAHREAFCFRKCNCMEFASAHELNV